MGVAKAPLCNAINRWSIRNEHWPRCLLVCNDRWSESVAVCKPEVYCSQAATSIILKLRLCAFGKWLTEKRPPHPLAFHCDTIGREYMNLPKYNDSRLCCRVWLCSNPAGALFCSGLRNENCKHQRLPSR
jgi:hypothetical protein